jgi:hypothetical protein
MEHEERHAREHAGREDSAVEESAAARQLALETEEDGAPSGAATAGSTGSSRQYSLGMEITASTIKSHHSRSRDKKPRLSRSRS